MRQKINFWKEISSSDLKYSSSLFLLFLVKRLKAEGGKEIILSHNDIFNYIKLNKSTILRSRQELKEKGLINFKPLKNKTTLYESLVDNLSLNIVIDKKKDKSRSKPQKEINSLNKADSYEKSFSDLPKIKGVPSFAEIVEFAKTVDGYDNSLEPDLEDIYRRWVLAEWKTRMGYPIRDWKLTLKSTISKLRQRK